MSKLITVHDFSPMQTTTAAILNGIAPAGKKLVSGPFNSLLWELVPTHTSLWTVRTDKLPFPQNIQLQWEEISRNLDNGKDVLLHTPTLYRPAHEFFHKQILERIDLQRHQIQSCVIIGSPSLLLDQYFRHPGFKPTPENIETYMGRLFGIPDLIRTLFALYGENSIKLLANTSHSAVADVNTSVLEELVKELDLDLPQPLPRSMGNPAFRSGLTRRLRSVMEVRDNAWPAIEPGIIENALYELDRDLPEDICSPLELRRKFADLSQGCLQELEELLHLDKGSLAAPAYLLDQPQSEPIAEIPAEICSSFCKNLGREAAAKLQERLRNDAILLNADQKAMLAFLESAPDYKVVGEPQPPVEVTVLTMTYNHEKFIAQCMDSVLAQKTDFPVRHIVLDHHSEDNTAGIIATYAEKHPSIRPVLLSHRRACENVYGLFSRCRSRYVALCDGDDYFLAPDKLQKQVDFLEKNPDYALCFHPVLAVFEDGRKPSVYPPLDTVPQRRNWHMYLRDLISTNFIQTNSVVYRWRFTEGLPSWFRADLCPGDWYWHLLHAETGKIGFLPEIMSAYRRHSGALYAQTLVSRVNHRRNLGLQELSTYKACDEHFKYRFHKPLSVLASGVFADFVELMMNEDEPRLLNWAVEHYPLFARDFLNSLSALEKGKQTTA